MKFNKLMKLEEGDLSYRVITAFEAPSAVVNPEIAGSFVTPQTFPVFKLDQERITPGYMSLFTTSPAFHSEMAARCTGTVLRRKTLSVGAFREIPINLPSLAEQRRIVDLISSLDDAIEAAGETSGLSEDSYEAGCHTLPTGRFLRGDYSYDLGTSGQLISKVTSGKTLPKDVTGQVRAFGSNGAVGWTNEANFEHGTVVLGRVGANCGSVNMPMSDFWATDNTLCVQGAYGVPPRYLYHLLRGLRLNQHRSGSGQPLITQRVVKEQPIALLPETEMREVAEILDGLEESHAASVAHAASLRKLRGELLTSLLSGAHTIPESYDEVMTVAEGKSAIGVTV